MSLKGYQWLNDNGEVIMSFTFKRLDLDIWEDTTKEELDNFIKFLKEQGHNTYYIDYHNHKVSDK